MPGNFRPVRGALLEIIENTSSPGNLFRFYLLDSKRFLYFCRFLGYLGYKQFATTQSAVQFDPPPANK